MQADQWIAATLFALHSFAAFSVAAVLSPLVMIFRRSVLEGGAETLRSRDDIKQYYLGPRAGAPAPERQPA